MRRRLQKLWDFARGRVSSKDVTVPRCEDGIIDQRVSSERTPVDTDLRARLKALGTIQADFADLCEVHPNTVSNWVSGRTRMNAAAEVLLEILESNASVRRAYCVGVKIPGAPRGLPFAKGNAYRFGDRRRRAAIAGAQMARATA